MIHVGIISIDSVQLAIAILHQKKTEYVALYEFKDAREYIRKKIKENKDLVENFCIVIHNNSPLKSDYYNDSIRVMREFIYVSGNIDISKYDIHPILLDLVDEYYEYRKEWERIQLWD